MYFKIINFSDFSGLPAASVQAYAVRSYNEAVDLSRHKKFAKAAQLLEKYQGCVTNLVPELELAWTLSLIKAKLADYSEKMSVSQVQKYDAPIEDLLSEYQDKLLEYAGITDDRTHGLLGCRLDTNFAGFSLRYFFLGLPEPGKISADRSRSIYDAPIVRDFFNAIVKNDLKKCEQNTELVRQIYQDGNPHLFYFFTNFYCD